MLIGGDFMYLLQKETKNNNFLNIEYVLWKELLDFKKEKYIELSKNELEKINSEIFQQKYNTKLSDNIPLGTIEFTNLYFQKCYNIEKMNPIEVPFCLRTEEFLKRKYSIIKGKDIPKNGNYFLKNVSDLKSFTFCGDLQYFFNNKDFPVIENEKYYQLSESIDILSEYRIYVISGKIYAIAYYNGNPCIFPDIQLINKANIIYSFDKEYPKSYTMDIAITNKGTCILEIHTLFSCGLYQTVLGTDFLQGYKDAKEYILKHNTLPKKS
jgi:hypothetical protein